MPAKKPMVRIHDVENDTILDREMTDEEYAQWQLEVAAIEAMKKPVNEA